MGRNYASIVNVQLIQYVSVYCRKKWHFPKCFPSVYTNVVFLFSRAHTHTHTHVLYRTITHIKHQQMPSWLNLTAQTQMEASGPCVKGSQSICRAGRQEPGKEGRIWDRLLLLPCWQHTVENTLRALRRHGPRPTIRPCQEAERWKDVNRGGKCLGKCW